MADEYPPFHDNAVGPFANVLYILLPGGLEEIDLEMEIGDRDVLLNIELDDDIKSFWMFHLKNVREDTLAKAENAVDAFLDHLEPLGDQEHARKTVFMMFDKVHGHMSPPISVAVGQVQGCMTALKLIDGNKTEYPKRDVQTGSVGDFNPVAEALSLCHDFVEQMQDLQVKSASCLNKDQPKRVGFTLAKENDKAHTNLRTYIENQAYKRGLAFDWGMFCYSECQVMTMRPRFETCYRVGKGWAYQSGDYVIPPSSCREQELDHVLVSVWQ